VTHKIYDRCACELGEGPIWHPEKKELLWFDIARRRLHLGHEITELDFVASAAGLLDKDRVILATEFGLATYSLSSGTSEVIARVESENPATRSNDGRADRVGGFWFSSMGWNAEPGLGRIYRYFRGELRCVRTNVTIPNAICFSPDGKTAYFADTALQKVYRQTLHLGSGWPQGEADVFLDLAGTDLHPDGAIVDALGSIWIAMWGLSAVLRYGPDGHKIDEIALPTPHVTCPAAGGEHRRDLFVTTATLGLSESDARASSAGSTFFIRDRIEGLPEPIVQFPAAQ